MMSDAVEAVKSMVSIALALLGGHISYVASVCQSVHTNVDKNVSMNDVVFPRCRVIP